MLKSIASFLSIIALLSTQTLSAQSTANQTIAALYSKMQKIKDYSVDAVVKADIPMIKIDAVNATIYFKQKDKLKVISKGIAILPKQGFSDVSKIIRDPTSFAATTQGKELVQNYQTDVLNVIPTIDTGDVVLAKLWIEPTKSLILKSTITSKTNGPVTVEYFYGSQIAFGLPDNMIFTVGVKKFKIPKGVATDIQKNSRPAQDDAKEPKVGKIYITLANYSINKGVKDEVFK